jgi:ketosteroid isomerase-like protein
MVRPTEVVRKFYQSFQALDGNAMAACYHPDVYFEDPAFGVLKGSRAARMWQMLCESQKDKDFQLVVSDPIEHDEVVKVDWEAQYIFSKTGRHIHNHITATLKVLEGRILHHVDHFSLHRWATQALGWKGWLLGGTPFFQKKLQQQTNRLLDKYIAAK